MVLHNDVLSSSLGSCNDTSSPVVTAICCHLSLRTTAICCQILLAFLLPDIVVVVVTERPASSLEHCYYLSRLMKL